MGASTLVVVDFYKTACGACKYIMPGFVRLCKQWGSDHESDVEIDLASTTIASSSSSSSSDGDGDSTSSISSIGMSSTEDEGSTAGSTISSTMSSTTSSSSEEAVVFVKHNVYDDEEETVTDLGRQYVIKVGGSGG